VAGFDQDLIQDAMSAVNSIFVAAFPRVVVMRVKSETAGDSHIH